MTTLLAPRPRETAYRPLAAQPKPAASTAPRSTKKVWVLAGSIVAHVGLFAALAQVIVRPSAAPSMAVTVTMEVPAQILPADGDPLEPEATSLPVLHESVPLTGMRWSPPDVKLPELPSPSAPVRGEVIGVAPSSVTSLAGAWTLPAGMGDGPPSGAAPEIEHAPSGTTHRQASGHRQPGYLRNPRPVYPREAVDNGWEGTTVLNVEVLASGIAGAIAILESSGYAVLDQAALTAVRRWRFIPARQGNLAVAAWAEVPVRFVLSEHAPRPGGKQYSLLSKDNSDGVTK